MNFISGFEGSQMGASPESFLLHHDIGFFYITHQLKNVSALRRDMSYRDMPYYMQKYVIF